MRCPRDKPYRSPATETVKNRRTGWWFRHPVIRALCSRLAPSVRERYPVILNFAKSPLAIFKFSIKNGLSPAQREGRFPIFPVHPLIRQAVIPD